MLNQNNFQNGIALAFLAAKFTQERSRTISTLTRARSLRSFKQFCWEKRGLEPLYLVRSQ